jgi:tripartite motif-containing protein 71
MARRTLLLAAALAAALMAGAVPAAGAYREVDRWGSLGRGPGEFGSGVLGGGSTRQYDDPAGIAVDRDGTILVVDPSNNRVQRFTSQGRFIHAFGRRGHDKGNIRRVVLRDRFFQPEGIAVDPAGFVYVADTGNERVMKLTRRGGFVKRIGHHGSYPGEFVAPWAVAAGAGALFVIDQGNYRVSRHSLGGAFRGTFGRFGRGAGQFVTPYGIAVGPGGRVYVTDHIRNVVMVFTTGGRLLAEFGSPGTGRGQFLRPAGVAVGPDGTVFVADRCNRRVQRFGADGAFIESFGRGALRTPTFLAVDRRGDVFVSDHHRVVRFSAAASSAAQPPRAAHHDGVDIQCRHVAEQGG